MPAVPSHPNTPDPDGSPAQPMIPLSPPSAPSPPPTVLAPPRRFAGARNSLGRFAHSGDQRNLKSGLHHYTRTGLGGAQRAAQRLGGTSKTAGALYGALDAIRTRTPDADVGLDPASLQGLSVGGIADRVIDAVRPADGTQDAEANRHSIANAIRDVLEQYPSADLLSLTPAQIELIIERYVAYDLCQRVELDVGNAVLKMAPGVAEGMRRLQEMMAYIREKVSACFRALRTQGRRLTRAVAASFASRVIEDTFTVFEEFAG